MRRHGLATLGLAVAVMGLFGTTASAQHPPVKQYTHYPYYYFPHNYAPNYQRWPQPHRHFQQAPAWMAYPRRQNPEYRYELHRPMRYYKGFHFWLDQF